jgi:oxygen-independent coproporphyrinogen-3 oxidase
MITDTVGALRKAGIGSINFDLMYGLPGQTLSDLEDTLDRSIALAPDRIALFGYAHLPSVFARQRRIDATSLPGARERFDQAAFGYERLTAAGYRAIGFDHFALPQDPLAVASRDGALRRNFQGFTDDDADVLIGLGASAISEFPDLLVQNEKMAGRYRMLVADGGLPGRRGVRRSAADRKRGDAIERLLCTGEAEMGEDLLAGARPALGAFMARGLLRCDGGRLSIQADGMPYARAIAACLDDYRTISIGQFSHAV